MSGTCGKRRKRERSWSPGCRMLQIFKLSCRIGGMDVDNVVAGVIVDDWWLFDAYAEDSSQLAQQQVLQQQQEDGECLAVSLRFGRPADMFLRKSANTPNRWTNSSIRPSIHTSPHPDVKGANTRFHGHAPGAVWNEMTCCAVFAAFNHCRMSGGQNLRFTTGFVRFESVAFRANFAGRLAVKQPFPYWRWYWRFAFTGSSQKVTTG